MDENKKVRVAITQGDTNGIGYELIFKTFADPEMLELCTPIVYGSPKLAAYHRKALDINAQFSIIQDAAEAKPGRVNLLSTFDEEVKVDLGQPTEESGMAALMALDRAMSDYRNGLYDVLVTAPLDRGNIKPEGYPFPGHTRYIETCVGEGKKALPILLNEQVRLAFMTGDVALKHVAEAITKEGIEKQCMLLRDTLVCDFRISNPRIAVLALNPGTNEDNQLGAEEKEIIVPAIDELVDKGVEAFGPYAADDFFGLGYFTAFDAVLAMYHDQGMAPFKALSSEPGVIYTAGLPLVRTASDQTPDYEHAGKNAADESAFRHAVYLAIDVFRHRQDFDEAASDPLKKLYREKRDESDKVRFSVPKRHADVPFPKRRKVEAKDAPKVDAQTASADMGKGKAPEGAETDKAKADSVQN